MAGMKGATEMAVKVWNGCGFDGCGFDVGGTAVAGCCDEPVSKKVERLEKELADAKAKLAAEAEKNKVTAGTKIVNNILCYGYQGRRERDLGGERLSIEGFSATKLAADIDRFIDKAYAEGAAAQREKDALLAQSHRLLCQTSVHFVTYDRDIASAIRDQK